MFGTWCTTITSDYITVLIIYDRTTLPFLLSRQFSHFAFCMSHFSSHSDLSRFEQNRKSNNFFVKYETFGYPWLRFFISSVNCSASVALEITLYGIVLSILSIFRIPRRGRIYSLNEANALKWPTGKGLIWPQLNSWVVETILAEMRWLHLFLITIVFIYVVKSSISYLVRQSHDFNPRNLPFRATTVRHWREDGPRRTWTILHR